MADHKTEKVECWHCHTELDGHMNVGGDNERPPEDGAISLCIYCGAWGTVVVVGGKVVELRTPTAEEWYDLTTDMQTLSYAAHVTQFRMENDIAPKPR